jgi:hypothetical protein
MTRYLLRALTAVAVLSAGCGDAAGPTGPQSAFEAARARWEAADPAAYSFVAFRSCECLPDAVGPVRIVVSTGAILEARRVSDDALVDASLWFTIDGLFDLIASELERLPDRVEAEYDAARGFPTEVTYGMPEVDAGATITITEFVG